MSTAHIIVDYQNIHLTGHELWCSSSDAPHLCLIHPLSYAHQILGQRNLIRRLVAEQDGEEFEAATLGSVRVFRGLPSNSRAAAAYRRSMAQKSEWTRSSLVNVHYRPLKYYGDGSVKEKGIDVLVALEVVKAAAQATDGDVIILAAHDTDQEPALELAYQLAGAKIETTGWMNSKRLRVKGHQTWHTQLDQQAFVNARDPKRY